MVYSKCQTLYICIFNTRKEKKKMNKTNEKPFNQLKYIDRYQKENYKRITIKIRKDNIELINWIEQQPNKQAYITHLIEKDMKKNS